LFKNTEAALSVYIMLMFWKSTILYVLIVRLSRFNIIPLTKRKVKFEFPFHYKAETNRDDFNFFFGLLTVKGESHNEARLAVLYQEKIRVVPLNAKKTHLTAVFEGVIEQKISVNESSLYILKLYLDNSKVNFRHYLVRPKTTGIGHTEQNDPIVSLNSIDTSNNNKLVFHEWVILKQRS
jgi:hypothetical protein